jgi:hypothetical protein
MRAFIDDRMIVVASTVLDDPVEVQAATGDPKDDSLIARSRAESGPGPQTQPR